MTSNQSVSQSISQYLPLCLVTFYGAFIYGEIKYFIGFVVILFFCIMWQNLIWNRRNKRERERKKDLKKYLLLLVLRSWKINVTGKIQTLLISHQNNMLIKHAVKLKIYR